MDELINEGVCPYLYKIAIAKKIDLRHIERIESERERDRLSGCRETTVSGVSKMLMFP